MQEMAFLTLFSVNPEVHPLALNILTERFGHRSSCCLGCLGFATRAHCTNCGALCFMDNPWQKQSPCPVALQTRLNVPEEPAYEYFNNLIC